jgi:lysophospholipase L1-like esterase
MRRLFLFLLKSLITTVVFFALAEVALRGTYAIRNAFVRFVPLPYALGDEYGPIPPWLDRLMILVPDRTLIWRMLPNVDKTYVDIFSPVPTAGDRTALLRRFAPTLPAEFRRSATWRIAINSDGFRTPEFGAKRAGVIRIACVGDSWTFGMPVNQDETYPSRLAARLRDAHPDQRYEVMNFGVLGYSSFQGLQLLRTRVLDLQPDVVAIGFGMNDSEVAGYRDRDMVGGAPPSAMSRIKDAAKDLESYKLLQYIALALRFHPKPMGDYLVEDGNDTGSGSTDYSTVEPWTRASPHDYEQNVREMIRLSTSRGARVVLLDNELWDESPYAPVLKKIASDERIPLVDTLAIIGDAKKQTVRDLEARLQLRSGVPAGPSLPAFPALPAPPALRAVNVVFRVYRGDVDVPSALSIVGPLPQLGNNSPNTVLMHDDGQDGDERAGDGVWSFSAAFAPGTRVTYVYTNSGARGRWEGLDLPTIRHASVPATATGGPIYLPVDTFGRVYMQGDNWHTNAAGYDLIARAVAQAIGQP